MDIEFWSPQLDSYLSVVEQQLKPLPYGDRVRALDEIRSRVEEVRFFQHCSVGDALLQLGDPKALAKPFLAQELDRTKDWSFRNLRIRACLFGKANIFDIAAHALLLFLSVATIGLGAITTLAAIVRTGAYLLGTDLPFSLMGFGAFEMQPLLVLPASLVLSAALVLAGVASWKYLRKLDALGRIHLGGRKGKRSINQQAY